ncbi:MAG: hypothetical protein AAFO76_11530 [Cyanobacteria bacterium J06607_15]
MISSNLVFVQLAQVDDYICIVELAMMLEASVSQVRHRLRELGDRVEHNDKDEWRIVKNIAPERILSEAEKAERDSLERTVQQAFFVAGQALKALRDKRLYRETHATFESYVRDRFDYTRRAADYLILAAQVVENLKTVNLLSSSSDSESLPKREQFVLKTNVLPTRESQCRYLAGHPPEIQRRAWLRAVELAGGKVPSARLVKQAVREITQSDDSKQNSTLEAKSSVEPSFREVNYTAGIGVEYTVRFDEETYYRLQAYQDKIGSATKSGAVARLLDAIAEQE